MNGVMFESFGRGQAGFQKLKVALTFLSAILAAAQRDIPCSRESDLSTLSLLPCTCNDLLVTESWAAG